MLFNITEIKRDVVNGIVVKTVDASKSSVLGLLNDRYYTVYVYPDGNSHTVARYIDSNQAAQGHKKYVKLAANESNNADVVCKRGDSFLSKEEVNAIMEQIHRH